ncbi:LysR family transcriptional regulator [Celerinatantimonas sp. YJH-8]|uniref:LysR family transcriptional regulator n=1 Tax=Celerinatantimonas sp. YJH-8 TaxID=3228714 RepID=UPI0038C7828F
MDLQRIDFNLLKVFRQLMQERQVSRAAARLHLSQPAVSHALKRLRTLFEDPLFIATGREMAPTPIAEQLSRTIEQVWQTLESGFSSLEPFNSQRSQRTFRFAVSGSIEYALIEPIYRALGAAGSGLKLECIELTRDDYLQSLAEREIDIVVGFEGSHHLHPKLMTEHWFDDPLYCLCGPHTQATTTPMNLADLISHPHIYTSSWGHSQTKVDDWLQLHHQQREIALRVPSFMAVPPLLMQHSLYAVVPRSVCQFLQRDLPIVARPLPQELDVSYCLAWHPLYKEEPALNWLLEQLRAIAPKA